MSRIALMLIALFLSASVFAHHSTYEFDTDVTIELTGELLLVYWRNPHLRMQLRVLNDGEKKVWEMEGHDINSLSRAGVSSDLLQAGQVVRVAGSPSTRRSALLVTNVLLADGREVLTHMSGVPRWNDNAIGNREAVRGTVDEYITPINDIFRAWTTVQSNTPAYSADPPLTIEARTVLDAFDPLVDDPVVRCVSPGMPEAMTYIGPHPVEFVQLADGDIEIRIESDDNTRKIHMNKDASAEGQLFSPLGYSIGLWEEDTLIVTTTRINWPWFKIFGIVSAPQSEAMEIVERFELDRSEGTLTYSFTSTDPSVFTKPVTADAYHVWRYRLGTMVQIYGCTLDELFARS
ncbi:MAG: DUF6152 family protein [Arenicellaceae bacterium]|nr:DUF6152 family protein [Arenicellaceae bacterium]